MGFFAPEAWQGGKVEQPRLPKCGACGLFKICQSPKMAPSGEGTRRILFVGEAPGADEDAQGEQFVGLSGRLLRRFLNGLDCDLDDCMKTNAAICRPPKNEIKDLHIESCRPNLLKAIRELKPRVIVLLGGSAVRSLLPTERDDTVGSVTRWIGWRIPSHEHQAWICPTYHPSYVLRMEDPVVDRMFKDNLRAALACEHKQVPDMTLEKFKAQIDLITKPRLARLALKDLARKRGRLSFDYEGTGRKPEHPDQAIVAASFCLEGDRTFACVVDDSVLPRLSKVLRSERLRKIGANIKNEERWTRAKMGHGVANWYWDTMLAAHILDNRRNITGLKFQAFVNFGIADYDGPASAYFERETKPGFNAIREMPVRDLLTYNGLDSLFQYKLHLRQRKAMGLS